ncbi:Hypothetical predicted protein [Cloeon dipterum]|uniref:Plastocyanin-like domain-containing protein n=2 Tax=Cloeon dipterum TaxID=197152 RepID=A0A8S1CJ31_9INSE|nr:Hypothetical predicted protein [Cloeon dipterum]
MVGEGMQIFSVLFLTYFLCAVGNPCERKCGVDLQPMTCHHKFTLHATTINCDHCQRKNRTAQCLNQKCDFASKLALSVNGKTPGPTIQVCLGDRIIVDVENRLPSSFETSIHWHGILQKGTPYYDGVSRVTQCPLTTGTSFSYSFVADNPGTHFYHADSVTQHADGIYGAIIVNEAGKRARENVILLGTRNDALVSGAYGALHGALVGQNKPVAKLILNGKANNENVDEFEAKLSETLFSFVNVAAYDCPFEIAMESHSFKVVNAQGSEILPVFAEKIVIYPGGRYDVEIYQIGEKCEKCVLKVSGLHKCSQLEQIKTVIRPVGDQNIATNEIKAKSLSANCSKDPSNLCNAQLEGVNPPDITFTPDLTFFLTFGHMRVPKVSNEDVEFRFVLNDIEYYPTFLDSSDEDGTLIPHINTVSFRPPSTPILSQYEDREPSFECESWANLSPAPASRPKSTCKGPPHYCECTHYIRVAVNATVKLVFRHESDSSNKNPGTFHLHGHKMYTANWRSSSDDMENTNKRPVAKDTIVVPPSGEISAFFKANNPGKQNKNKSKHFIGKTLLTI